MREAFRDPLLLQPSADSKLPLLLSALVCIARIVSFSIVRIIVSILRIIFTVLLLVIASSSLRRSKPSAQWASSDAAGRSRPR